MNDKPADRIPPDKTGQSVSGILAHSPRVAEMYAKQSEATIFGTRINESWRGGGYYYGGHEKAGGPTMHWQAPVVSSPFVTAEPQYMMRVVPSTLRRTRLLKNASDPMPDFSIISTEGPTLTLKDFLGKPFAMRLTRTIAGGYV